MRSRFPLLVPPLAVLALSLGACGGAADVQPKAPPSTPSDESARPAQDAPASGPATIEEAQEMIARAKGELLGGGGGGAGKGDAKKSDVRPGPTTEAPRRSEPAPPAPAPSATPPGEDRCASSCRALGSMRRAVEALCRMTGDSDARCTEARKTLEDSIARVGGCGC